LSFRHALILALAAAGCASAGRPGADDTGPFTIEFTWEGVPPCSNVSPRLQLRGAPPGTRRYRVELVDLDSAISRHGGGEVPADPSGVVPAGALKDYRGPCPSQHTINYEMRVQALDEGGRVLARATERLPYTVQTLIRRGRR
jgi:phosphatidylethanolamine-binding protein (PEBP) family uncharacterized protein